MKKLQLSPRKRSVSVPIHLQDHDLAGHFSQMLGAARKRWPVRVGVPWPQGALRDPAALRLLDGKTALPMHCQVTARHGDGSVSWLSVLALVDLEVSERKILTLAAGPRPGAAAWPKTWPQVVSSEDDAELTLSNGELTLVLGRTLETLRISRHSAVVVTTPPALELELDDGRRLQPRWTNARLEIQGSLQQQVVLTGKYVSGAAQELFDVELGLSLTAGQSWIECFHRLTHRVPGQAQLTVRRLAWGQDWQLGQSQYVVRQQHRGEEWLPRDVRKNGLVEVRVPGGRAHVADHAMVDEIPAQYPPYLQKGLDTVEPWLAAAGPEHTTLFWMADAAGHSPQGWTLDNGRLSLELIPPWAPPAVFPQGRAKTHVFRFHLADTPPAAAASAPGVHSVSSPFEHLALLHRLQPLAGVDPAWAHQAKAGELAHALPYQPQRFPRFELLLSHLFEIKWPQGMMDFGDDADPGYTKGYAASGMKRQGAVWTNNEYDYIYATIQQMLRTGQNRLLAVVRRCAAHALDVDFVHFHDDPWLHHGSPAHSAEHTTASSYPSHIWTQGLLHFYYLTGEARALQVATASGDFILRYQEQRWWVFTETARESGWAILALAELYAATGEERFLAGARRIRDFIVTTAAGKAPLFPGEASFFIGVLVMGLDKLHELDPDRRIPPTILRIMAWRLANRRNAEGIPLYHWDAGARMLNSREIMFPGALAIACRHSGDESYRQAAWRALELWLEQGTFHDPTCTKSAAAYYRTWIEVFAQLADAGVLEQLEFPSTRATQSAGRTRWKPRGRKKTR